MILQVLNFCQALSFHLVSVPIRQLRWFGCAKFREGVVGYEFVLISSVQMAFLVMDKLTIFFPYFKAEKLSLSLGEYSFDKNEEHLKDINMKEKNLEDYWKKAKEILHRIEELETEGNEVGFFVSNNTELFSKFF